MGVVMTFGVILAVMVAVIFVYPMLRVWMTDGTPPAEALSNMGKWNIIIVSAVTVVSAAVFTAIIEVGA